jgi:hypothetical protein
MTHPLRELTEDQAALLHARLHNLITAVQGIRAVGGVEGGPIDVKVAEIVAAIESLSADLSARQPPPAGDVKKAAQQQASERAHSEVASGEFDMQG